MPDSRDPQLDDLRRRARRRLIGAVVLALAATVLVPLLLESDPKPLGEDVAVKIPPIGEGRFAGRAPDKRKGSEPASIPESKAEAAPTVAATATEAAKDVAKAPPETPREAATPVSATPMAKSLASAEQRVLAPPGKAAPAAAPAPAKVAAPPATKDAAPAAAPKSTEPAPKVAELAPRATDADMGAGFSVQLAAFTDDKGANALAAKLKKSGYPAYTEPYDTSRGKLWRVRVGPFPSRDAAESVRAKLKVEGQSGFIAAAK